MSVCQHSRFESVAKQSEPQPAEHTREASGHLRAPAGSHGKSRSWPMLCYGTQRHSQRRLKVTTNGGLHILACITRAEGVAGLQSWLHASPQSEHGVRAEVPQRSTAMAPRQSNSAAERSAGASSTALLLTISL